MARDLKNSFVVIYLLILAMILMVNAMIIKFATLEEDPSRDKKTMSQSGERGGKGFFSIPTGAERDGRIDKGPLLQ